MLYNYILYYLSFLFIYSLSFFLANTYLISRLGFPSQRPLVHLGASKDVVQQRWCAVSQSMRTARYWYNMRDLNWTCLHLLYKMTFYLEQLCSDQYSNVHKQVYKLVGTIYVLIRSCSVLKFLKVQAWRSHSDWVFQKEAFRSWSAPSLAKPTTINEFHRTL